MKKSMVIFGLCLSPALALCQGSDSLSKLYRQLTNLEGVFSLTNTDSTVTIGKLDLTIPGDPSNPIKPINFNYAIPTYSDGSTYTVYYHYKNVITEPIDGCRRCDPVVFPQNKMIFKSLGGTIDLAYKNLRVKVLISNMDKFTPGSVIYISLGGQVDTIHQESHATEAVFTNVPEGELPMSISVSGYKYDGADPYVLPGILPLNVKNYTVGAGAITIPVLPFALVYSPTADIRKRNETSFQPSLDYNFRASISFKTSKGLITGYFIDVRDAETHMESLASSFSLSTDPIILNLANGLHGMAQILASQIQRQNAPLKCDGNNKLFINDPISSPIVVSSLNGGPGLSDIIGFYRNVRLFWYSDDGTVKLVVLGFDSIGLMSVQQLTSLSLNTLSGVTSSSVSQLDQMSARNLLNIDPFVVDPANITNDTNRFVSISQGAINIGEYDLPITLTHTPTDNEHKTSITFATNLPDSNSKFASFFGDNGSSTGIQELISFTSNITSTVSTDYVFHGSLNGSYAFRIFYDNVFGSFVFLPRQPTDAIMMVSGRYMDKSGHKLANATVSVKIAHDVYIGHTDKYGKFRIPVSKSDSTSVIVYSGTNKVIIPVKKKK